MITTPHRVGIRVDCSVCKQAKKPHGRSAPNGTGYCDDDCPGYTQEPLTGCLWWGETDADFGYLSCTAATRPMNESEVKRWHEKHS